MEIFLEIEGNCIWYYEDGGIRAEWTNDIISSNSPYHTNPYWEELVHPDDRPIVSKRFKDFVYGLIPFYREVYRIKKNPDSNKYIHIISHGVITKKDGNGKALVVQGNYIEIQERMVSSTNCLKAFQRRINLANQQIIIPNTNETDDKQDLNQFTKDFFQIHKKKGLSKALDYINENLNGDSFHFNTIQLLYGRHSRIELQLRKGIILQDKANIEINSITMNLFEIIKELDTSDIIINS